MLGALAAAILAAADPCALPAPGACAPTAELFERARELLAAGDRRAAIALLERLRAEEGPSPSTALLEGICYFELGESARAKPLLEEAARKESVADSARYFLGLIALREGETDAAAEQLGRVSEGSPLHDRAAGALRSARSSGRLSLNVVADSGYDSNLTLAPSGAPGAGDGGAGILAALVVRPAVESGFFARATGLYRAQLQLHDYDVGALGGGAGYQLGGAARHLVARYDYDYLALGGAPFLSAHRLGVSGQTLWGDVAVGGAWAVRSEDYRTQGTASFSGTLHTGEAWVGFRSLELGYRAGRDFARLPETSFLEHGPRVALRLDRGARLRAFLEADAALRRYDAPDASLGGVRRSDLLVNLGVIGELDVTDRLTARLGLGGRQAFSNVDALAYLRTYVTLGAAYAVGVR